MLGELFSAPVPPFSHLPYGNKNIYSIAWLWGIKIFLVIHIQKLEQRLPRANTQWLLVIIVIFICFWSLIPIKDCLFLPLGFLSQYWWFRWARLYWSCLRETRNSLPRINVVFKHLQRNQCHWCNGYQHRKQSLLTEWHNFIDLFSWSLLGNWPKLLKFIVVKIYILKQEIDKLEQKCFCLVFCFLVSLNASGNLDLKCLGEAPVLNVWCSTDGTMGRCWTL